MWIWVGLSLFLWLGLAGWLSPFMWYWLALIVSGLIVGACWGACWYWLKGVEEEAQKRRNANTRKQQEDIQKHNHAISNELKEFYSHPQAAFNDFSQDFLAIEDKTDRIVQLTREAFEGDLYSPNKLKNALTTQIGNTDDCERYRNQYIRLLSLCIEHEWNCEDSVAEEEARKRFFDSLHRKREP